MMKLFYHHVGQAGFADFDKTVFREVPISIIEENIPESNPLRTEILEALRTKFPSGYFNCWGVPEGAKFVVQNLNEGDCVLLVESVRINGRVPALCRVEAFWQTPLRTLSKALWGNDKFPYIFFFRTDEITMMWADLLESFGYKENFDPRGKFYSVAASRLSSFPSIDEFVHSLHAKYSLSKKAFDVVTATDLELELEKDEMVGVGEVRRELEEIRKKSLASELRLREGLGKQLKESYTLPRNAAFVIAVRRLYGYRCIFCGLAIRAPNGRPEVQSAHVYPKRFDGSDNVRNGICLCRRHHWAFDVGWLAISDDYTTLVQSNLPTNDDYLFIRELAGRRIREPLDPTLSPHPMFLKEQRKLMGFER